MTVDVKAARALPSMRLDGLRVLVTGASRGIGLTIARAAAEAGADLGLLGRDAARLEESAALVRAEGRRAELATADVRDTAELRAAAEALIDSLGGVDVLVNCAGVNVPQAALEVTEEAWDEVLDVNLRAVFFLSQTVARRMLVTGGSIVNVSSQMGHVGYRDRAAYVASKHALTGLTKVLAIEWAPHAIRVNAVAPTFVETELVRTTLADPELRADVLGRIPIGRFAQTEDVSGAVVFLASPAAAMVTGGTILVDGGWVAW